MLKANNEMLDYVQKRLEDYLETKRVAFPRFYFLSNDELLAILSDVRNPMNVQPHLQKCFDNIKELRFKTQSDIEGMISGENEYVGFTTPVVAKGAVESWLSDIEVRMRSTILDQMKATQAGYAACTARALPCAIGGANPAHNLGDYHGTGKIVPFVNYGFEWEVVVSTFLSVLSIVPCHCARLTYFLHPKLRKINAVLITLKLTTLTLRRMRRAVSAPIALPSLCQCLDLLDTSLYPPSPPHFLRPSPYPLVAHACVVSGTTFGWPRRARPTQTKRVQGGQKTGPVPLQPHFSSPSPPSPPRPQNKNHTMINR